MNAFDPLDDTGSARNQELKWSPAPVSILQMDDQIRSPHLSWHRGICPQWSLENHYYYSRKDEY